MTLEQQPDPANGRYALSPASSFALDLIRTLAAQMVVVGHSIRMLDLAPFLQPPHFAFIQNIGVVMFFVLSGLLISYSVLSRLERPTFQSYFIDRFSRIYSGLVPSLLFVAVVDGLLIYLGAHYVNWKGYSLVDFAGNLLMLQDYPILGTGMGITSFGTARILWTLAIEWWFYMLFGWLVLSRSRGPRFWLVLAILLPVPLYNVIGGRGDGLTAMWILGLGCYLILRAKLLRFRSQAAGWTVVSTLVLIAGARLFLTKDAYDLLFAVLAAAALTTLISVLDAKRPYIPQAIERSVKFAADYSFTLYLVHLTVIAFLMNFIGAMAPWAIFAVLVIAANLVAVLLALKTEMQHHRLRRLLKQRFTAAALPAVAGKPAE